MLERIYYRLHRLFSRPQERGEYSSGVWQDNIRGAALRLISGRTGQLLEVGCGEGLFLAQAAKADPGMELWGVDNSSIRIGSAKKRLPGKNIHLSVEDAVRLPFANRSFDQVVCINVFFNMPSGEIVRKTLSQMKRVAKDDARLVFDFRNADNLLLALKYKFAPLYDHTVRDLPLKTYSISRIRQMLDEAGLEMVSLHYPGARCRLWAPVIMIEAKKK